MTSEFDVILGLDVGKTAHHGCALTAAGERVYDKALPQDETALQTVLDSLQAHGQVLVVVDQPNTIGALRIGDRQYLHIGAASRALLSFSDPEGWGQYLESPEFTAHPTRHALTRDQLVQHMEKEREQGYTLSDGDVQVGLAAAGAPIYGSSGEIIASISMSGLRDELIVDDIDTLSTHVRQAAAEISELMGYRGI